VRWWRIEVGGASLGIEWEGDQGTSERWSDGNGRGGRVQMTRDTLLPRSLRSTHISFALLNTSKLYSLSQPAMERYILCEY
jgi:hypothetical protein